MQKSGYKRQLLAYGLVCAGTLGVFGSALAGHHMEDEQTKAEAISSDVNTFNENRASLKEESAARAGTTTGDLNGSARMEGEAAMGAERDGELSSDVKQFNQSGGSLNADSAASADLDDNTQASGHAAHGASAESKDLSERIKEHNKNAE